MKPLLESTSSLFYLSTTHEMPSLYQVREYGCGMHWASGRNWQRTRRGVVHLGWGVASTESTPAYPLPISSLPSPTSSHSGAGAELMGQPWTLLLLFDRRCCSCLSLRSFNREPLLITIPCHFPWVFQLDPPFPFPRSAHWLSGWLSNRRIFPSTRSVSVAFATPHSFLLKLENRSSFSAHA